MESLLVMMRAHEESQTKARRLKEAWSKKRRDADKVILTTRCPAWLRARPDRTGFDVIPERAGVVRRIFEMLADGQGQHAITEALNRDGVPTWGDGNRRAAVRWHRSYVAKIINNPAVIGTFVPHVVEDTDGRKKRRKPKDAVPDYFPAVIDEELYHRVRAIRLDSVAPLRGRHANGTLRNILGGIAKCPLCSGTMTRVTKGAKKRAGRPYLVCDKAKAGDGCKYHSVKLDAVEDTIQQHASFLCGTCPAPGEDGDSLDAAISTKEFEIDHMREEVHRLITSLRQGGSTEVMRAIRDLEGSIEKAEEELNVLQDKRAAAFPALLDRRVAELEAVLTAIPLDIAQANLRLRECFSSVTVDYERGELVFSWKHGGQAKVMFAWPEDVEYGSSTPAAQKPL